MQAKGTVFKYGDNVDTDVIIPARYLAIADKKELAEQVDELTSKYEEQHNTLIKNRGDFDGSTEASLVSQYAQLSKGVNNLGENVSLTAAEYEKYHSVTNEIAGLVPSLVAGYDAQGNAILNTRGSVDELVKSYEKLIEVQNNKILKKAGNIEKDFSKYFCYAHLHTIVI